MKNILLGWLMLMVFVAQAQEPAADRRAGRQSPDIANKIVYSSAWGLGFRLRTDGWALTGEYSKNKNYFRSTLYQFEIAEFRHPKQERQNKDPFGGIFGNNGIRPFVFGKQYSMFALHASIGQRFLLAEKARKNGVMLNYFYSGGISLAILKPYYIKVCADPRCTSLEIITYDPSGNNKFLDYNYIYGGAGFGTGWGLKFRPGLHAKTGLQFDWSSQDDFVKAVEIGLNVDAFINRIPIMVTDENKFIFLSAYVGFTLGKKK